VTEDDPVVIELYGVPRLRAGRGEVSVRAATVAEALRALEVTCPALAGLVRPDGRPAPHYLLSLDGSQFLDDPDRALRPGQRLVLLSADAGG
jgi:hypothetical protein